MRLERLITILFSATLLTLFTPSCVRTRPLPVGLQNYTTLDAGKNQHVIRLAAARDLAQLAKDMDCGRNARKCQVSDAGRVLLIQFDGQLFLVQQSIEGAFLTLMDSVGCKTVFRCATDGKTISIEQRR
jgi:hypothetical protein